MENRDAPTKLLYIEKADIEFSTADNQMTAPSNPATTYIQTESQDRGTALELKFGAHDINVYRDPNSISLAGNVPPNIDFHKNCIAREVRFRPGRFREPPATINCQPGASLLEASGMAAISDVMGSVITGNKAKLKQLKFEAAQNELTDNTQRRLRTTLDDYLEVRRASQLATKTVLDDEWMISVSTKA